MKIRDVMIHDVHSLSPTTTLSEAEAELKARGVALLAVVSGDKIAGMVTDRALRSAAANHGLASGTIPVSDAMIPAATCRENDDIDDGLKALDQAGTELPGIIVVNSDGDLAGVALARDLREGTLDLPPVVGAYGASEPKVGIEGDPVDHRSEESFPASDAPPPPSSLTPQSADEDSIEPG